MTTQSNDQSLGDTISSSSKATTMPPLNGGNIIMATQPTKTTKPEFEIIKIRHDLPNKYDNLTVHYVKGHQYGIQRNK